MGGCPGELWVGEQRWGLRELTWLPVKGGSQDSSVSCGPGAEVTGGLNYRLAVGVTHNASQICKAWHKAY